jgi:hypothetical protein
MLSNQEEDSIQTVNDVSTRETWNTYSTSVKTTPNYYLNWTPEGHIPRIEIGFQQIVFNVPHPSMLHVKDKHTRTMLIMVIQEIKQNIYISQNETTTISSASDKSTMSCVTFRPDISAVNIVPTLHKFTEIQASNH